jgi:hypothetical protein
MATDEEIKELLALIDHGRVAESANAKKLVDATQEERVEIVKTDVVRQTLRQRLGFASRSTSIIGKDFDEISEELEIENELYDGRIKRILRDELLKRIKEITSGELEERPIHSRLEQFKKRLLDSIRIEIGDDDIPMIMADPNPLIFQFMPDKRDWSKVRLPTLEIIKEAAKHIRENQSEEVSNENYEDVEEVFYRRLLSLLESTSEGSAEEDIGESVGEGWLSLYLTGLSRPMVTSQTGTGFENDVHDAFGHVGIGRGFDRHGEWANALAVISMLDLPMFDDFTPKQKDGLKRMMLDKLAYPHFQKIPGDIGREKSDGWWTNMTYGYTGDIQTVIDMLDVSDRTQVLNDDGSPKESRPTGFASSSRRSLENIKPDMRDKIVLAEASYVFASRSTRIDGKDIDQVSKELELNDKELKILLEDDLLGDIEEITSGEFEKRPIHPRLEAAKKRLLSSIRIEMSDDGIPMIMADPNPLIFEFIPDKRDWSRVRVPKRKTVKAAAKHIQENQSENMYDDSAMESVQVDFREFEKRLLKMLYSLREPQQKTPKTRRGKKKLFPQYEEPDIPGKAWLNLYLSNLLDPSDYSVINDDAGHDAFGHVGIGRGFDRHGEWANPLAVISMLERPEFDDFTPEQKEGIRRRILATFAVGRIEQTYGTGFGENYDEDMDSGSWETWIYE